MKMILSGFALLIASGATAQDSTKKANLVISGSVDAYYRYNFHHAKDSGHANNYTSFTNSQNSFELGMASIKAESSMGKAAAVLDLGFGKRAEEFSYNDRGTTAAIKQAYISYAISEKIKFTMGKWMTHIGYELCDAYLNRNYSMDYMFSYGPFFHTGLKADITLHKNIAFMLGVANPADWTTASFTKKHFLGQLHLNSTNGKVNGYLNYMVGKDRSDAAVTQVDAIVTAALSDNFNIGYNGAVKWLKQQGEDRASWWGSAIYLQYDPTTVFGLTARTEYFDDKNGVAGLGTGIIDFTLSGNIHVNHLTIIPELRFDGAGDPVFFKAPDKQFPSARNTGTFLLAVTYYF